MNCEGAIFAVTEPGEISAIIPSVAVTPNHAGERRLQNEVVVIIRLDDSRPEIDETEQLADEKETYCGFLWWSVHEIEASAERFYPGSLQKYVRRALEGERIEEPFEYFS